MNLHRVSAVVALMLVIATGGSTQPSAQSAKPILAAMWQASGGEAWDNIRSLRYTTTVSAHGQHFSAEHWEDVSSGRYMVRAILPDHISEQGFDGITPWQMGGSGIAYTLGDIDAAEGAAVHSFVVSRSWWFHDRHPATIAFSRVQNEGGRSFDVLEVTPEGGRPFEAWIDRESHLLTRTVEQQAEHCVTTVYTNYHAVHGVRLPFTIKSDGEIETISSVEINPRISDAIYAIPPRPPSDITLPRNQTSVKIPFRLTGDNEIVIPLKIDGQQTIEAQFDSGGSLVLQPAIVKKLAIETAGGKTREHGGGGGSVLASKGKLASIALGGAIVTNVGFNSFTFDSDYPERALVGIEILQRFVVTIDFDNDVMTLTNPNSFSYRGSGIVLPFVIQDNQPEIKGSIDGISGLFTIDTGDDGSLLLIAPFARRYDLVRRYQADLPYGGESVTATMGVWARKRVSTVAFDGLDGRPLAVVHDPITRISLQHDGFDADRDVSANIGLGILRQFNMTFDYPHRRIILTHSHFYGRKDIFDRSGMVLVKKGDVWCINAIYPGGPAEEAGLKVGDVLTSINGKAATSFNRGPLRSIMRRPVGTELRLGVRSAGLEHHLTLVLRDIL